MINPYLPDNEFVPDGELRLFDGRVYLYGSHDLPGGKALCEGDYVCWSAPEDDLGHWRCEGTIYRRMQDPYIARMVQSGKGNSFNQYLYAPDVIKIEGQYYLYYGVAMSGSGIGVAVADAPAGPFRYLGRVRYPDEAVPAGWKDTEDGIEDGDMALGMGVPMVQFNPFKKHFGIHMREYPYDPAVLYDEGRLFLYFGCGYCYVAELSVEDKRTLIKNPRTGRYFSERLLPASAEKEDRGAIEAQNGWHMGNGPSIRKIGDTYYLSYYAVGRNGCHAICYSTADAPLGPFTYKGVLVSLGNGGYRGQQIPTAYTGNTHGGMVQAAGRWYLNYHRQTGSRCPARQACLTEMELKEDGTFEQAEFRSQIQKEGGLAAGKVWPACIACVLVNKRGQAKKGRAPYLELREYQTENRTVQVVTGLCDGCEVGIKYLDFRKQGNLDVTAGVFLKNSSAGRVEIYVDGTARETRAGEIITSPTGEQGEWFFGTCRITPGIHAVYYRFYGQKKDTDFISIRF